MTFDDLLAQAVHDRVIPGVVLAAENKQGTLHYEKTVGFASIEPGHERPLRRDTAFSLMSMTKLVTAVAVLQAVERGQVSLDDATAVETHLPELSRLPVLTGYDANETPLLEKRKYPITLRMLLTHTSGVGYDFLTPALVQYRGWAKEHHGEKAINGFSIEDPPKISATPASVEDRFGKLPLVFQPGHGWAYGAGVDWAGRLLERVTQTPLETLLVRDILDPLGLPAGSLTFHPQRYPTTAKSRLLPSLPTRREPGGPVVHGPPLLNRRPDQPFPEAALGGQGLYGDAASYLRILASLLRDDGLLLPSSAVDLLLVQRQFLPSTSGINAAECRAALLASIGDPEWLTGDVPDTGGEYDWALGGLLVTGSSHPYRRKGAVLWSGAINLTWIIDRTAGLCAVFAANFNPPADPQAKELMRAWEEYIYPQVAKL